MNLSAQLPGLLCLLALLTVGGPVRAQLEGFGGDGEDPAPAAEQDEEESEGGEDGDEPDDAGAVPGAPLPGAPESPLFPEPSDDEEVYPSAPLAEDPPAALEGQPPPASEVEPAPPGADEPGADDASREELYEPVGKQAVAKPLVEPDPDPAPDGWGNWSASALQYGTGVCSACACCGTSGVIGGIALAAGIVIPGGSVLFGPLVGCFGCVSIVGAPGVGTTAAVFLREWVGIWRGPWMLTLLAAYAVELLAVAVIAGGAIGAALLLASFISSVQGPGGFYDINPVDQWAWDQAGLGAGVFLGTFLTGLGFAIVAPSAAGTVVYQLMGEQKHNYDIGFRMPGFFGPNHPDPPKVIKPDTKGHERNRARPVPEPASMRF